MKTPRLICSLLTLAALNLCGQGANSIPNPAQTIAYSVVERGANHNIWERTTYETDNLGVVLPRTNRVTELATGLNYPKGGQWVPSKAEIDLSPSGGAEATQGGHKVYFPADIFEGAVDLITPDGIHWQHRPLCLAYFDGTNNVLIAELTNSVGQLVGGNQIIYPNAFTDFKADMRYTYTKAGLEQDVIFKEQIPAPEAYGMNSQYTRLECLTEFFGRNEPSQATPPNSQDGLSDTKLMFGSMTMRQGTAFSVGIPTNSSSAHVPVFKSWLKSSGRKFLVEELPYQKLESQLLALPTRGQNGLAASPDLHKVSASRVLPPQRLVNRESKKAVQLAKASSTSQPNVVLDYVVALNMYYGDNFNGYTFLGNSTYLISDLTSVDNPTFEAGTVIKFTTNSQAGLSIQGTIRFDTGPYHPAVFTAADDNSVGDSMAGVWSGYTGTIQPGSYGNPAIQMAGQIHDVRICYAQQAIQAFWGAGVSVTNAQIIGCNHGVVLLWEHGTGELDNCLIANCGSDAVAGGGIGSTFNLNFCTVDNCPQLSGTAFDDTDPQNINAADSIFSNLGSFGTASASSGGYNGFLNSGFTIGDNPITAPDGSYVYDTEDPWFYGYQYVNYYLAGGGPFSQVGTSDPAYISAAVLADIATKSTAFPQPWSSGFGEGSQDTTLGPVVSGDSSATPDLGYHYDRVDYIFGDDRGPNYISVHITIAPGTAIVWSSFGGGGQGIILQPGGHLTFQGTEQNPCYYVRGNTVWENDTGGDGAGVASTSASSPPLVDADFTRFSVIGSFDCFGSSGASLLFSATNCEFRNGTWEDFNMGNSLTLFNCLFADSIINAFCYSGDPVPALVVTNCTFSGGGFEVLRSSGVTRFPVDVVNCAFDGVGLGISDFPSDGFPNVYCDYNAGVTGTSMNRPGTHDVSVPNGFNWQSGPLGNFYLPINSPLIDAGNVTADRVGLYEYTTRISANSMEGRTLVDIGYHYLALNGNGNPVSTLVNGIPDYISDTNGNGLPDAWEIEYFGQIGVDPYADPDGDGLLNFEEFLLGTNPTLKNVPDGVIHIHTPLQ